MNEFKKFGLNATLINNLKKQYIKSPTPIQNLTIKSIMNSNDIIAEAQTGTGKTLAFLLPMFHNFNKDSSNIQGLIITPTRELAIQITNEAEKINEDINLNILSIYGGRDIGSQLRKLNNNIDLIIATPGRLIDHLNRKTIDLKHLKTFVIDEADQMLLNGFKNEIDMILNETNKNKQILCFSATLNSKVKKLAYRIMKNPKEFIASKENVTLDEINQRVITSSDRWKQEALLNELDNTNPFLAIIFCRTKRRANDLEEAMALKKYNCAKIHSDIKQNVRQRVMKSFRSAKLQYLIATDLASRGLDITGITHIYNFDIPETAEIYIHRIGRTGRMGKDGNAITFVTPRDKEKLNAIENKIKMKIPQKEYIRSK
ncbi:MAG: DEAD/DEAH box helicase [Bacillota bacterium]|nr:DEAD/DEAH box helicase [Bacillota bacterium]